MPALDDQSVPPRLVVFDQQQTASLIDFGLLVDEIARVALEYESGRIHSPERQVVPMGADGVLLSMPATAADLSIHKLVNVHPSNAQRQLPAIHGVVTVCDSDTGKLLCMLDGPEVTGRRTAAVSMLALRTYLDRAPRDILLIGTGTQTRYHVHAIRSLHPACRVWIKGRRPESSEAFCRSLNSPLVKSCNASTPADVDAVITLTSSTVPVYEEPASAGRLIIGVGAFKPEMAELGKMTLDGSDLYSDDPVGARHEAGDFLQAGVDWSRVHSLAGSLTHAPNKERPIVFKSVGTAAWDLAAARVAMRSLGIPHT